MRVLQALAALLRQGQAHPAAAAAADCQQPVAVRLFSSAAAGAPPAFVFDIDGVLVQGRHVLPQAKR